MLVRIPIREEIMDHNYPSSPRQQRHAFLSVFLTLIVLGFILLALIFVSGGIFLYVMLFGGVMAFVAMLHYVLWGRAFSAETAGEREEEKLRRRAASVREDDEWQTPDTRIRR
jgi:fatty acid desaturase